MALAYLFERFPSFTQTFCVREVVALRRRGRAFPVFAIRQPSSEPDQDYPDGLGVTHLPESFDALLAEDAGFRRRARRAQEDLVALWGDEGEKRRIYEALWLARECQRLGITHVHTHFAGVAARAAFWLNRIGGVGFSLTAHANDFFCDDSPERLGQIFAAARCVVTVSDFSVRDLRAKFPKSASKVVRVYNGIACAEFPAADPVRARPVLVSVGRYIEKKGFPDLIAACALLGDGDWECHLVGQGPMEDELRGLIAAAGLADRVFLTGPKRESAVRDLLATARAFVLPCVVESGGGMDNLPTVIMEAMAAGLPVIATPVAGVPEMVVDGETGWIVPEHSPERLAAAIREAMEDPGEASRRGANGLQLCRERFDLAVTSASLEKIFIDHGVFESPKKRGWMSFFRR